MKKTLLLITMPLLAGNANAQNCKNYIGSTVQASTFSEALKSINSPAPKGEFETTVDYKKRVKQGNIPKKLIISKRLNKRNIFYDADSQKMKIKLYAFSTPNAGEHLIDKYNTPGLELNLKSRNSHLIPFESKATSSEIYEARNAYGTKVKVKRQYHEAEVLIDPRKLPFTTPVFKRLYTPTYKERNNKDALRNAMVIGEVKMDVPTAKSVKNTSSLAVVVRPVEPYKLISEYIFPEAKINSPYEGKYVTKSIVGLIQCGLWLDDKGVVIDAYRRNDERDSLY